MAAYADQTNKDFRSNEKSKSGKSSQLLSFEDNRSINKQQKQIIRLLSTNNPIQGHFQYSGIDIGDDIIQEIDKIIDEIDNPAFKEAYIAARDLKENPVAIMQWFKFQSKACKLEDTKAELIKERIVKLLAPMAAPKKPTIKGKRILLTINEEKPTEKSETDVSGSPSTISANDDYPELHIMQPPKPIKKITDAAGGKIISVKNNEIKKIVLCNGAYHHHPKLGFIDNNSKQEKEIHRLLTRYGIIDDNKEFDTNAIMQTFAKTMFIFPFKKGVYIHYHIVLLDTLSTTRAILCLEGYFNIPSGILKVVHIGPYSEDTASIKASKDDDTSSNTTDYLYAWNLIK